MCMLSDKNNMPVSGMTRRQVVAAALAVCAGALCPGAAALALDEGKTLDAGPLADFAKDGIWDKWAASHGVYVVRRGPRLYALTATCSHKAATVKAEGAQFRCPKHGSTFAADGTVTKGPAKLPLVRHGIKLDGQGHVIIDGRTFTADKWDDPAAFINVR